MLMLSLIGRAKKERPKWMPPGRLGNRTLLFTNAAQKVPILFLVLVKCEWNTQPRADDLRVAQSIKQKQGYRAAFLLEITQAEFQLFKV